MVVLVAAAGLLAGCVESSDEEARTPDGAPTVVNSALQTDSNGETVTAPGAPAPGGAGAGVETDGGQDAGGGAEAPAGGGGGEEATGGDAAAGQQFFASTCTSCHMNNGQDAGGIGPQLAGKGLTPDVVRQTVENGRGAMPPGLAQGEDLDNVVAYVVSLQ
ncbi:c-type cytochrome [Miltoncostaea marina]|uniref:c-type cytochrome n=1 Tax=Miltoncostaea marina TaxID=2843215 RepID=UPI001C3E718F|nr:cytochrome c [Miltoncostaea marina]